MWFFKNMILNSFFWLALLSFLICVVSLCVIPALVIDRIYRPGNQVRVAVENLPQDVFYASIIADTDSGLKNMHWLVANPWTGTREPIHPNDCTWSMSYFKDGPKRIDWDAWVQWEWGSRYGVVTMNRKEEWSVAWFGAEEIPLEGRAWGKGDGKASFDLADDLRDGFRSYF